MPALLWRMPRPCGPAAPRPTPWRCIEAAAKSILADRRLAFGARPPRFGYGGGGQGRNAAARSSRSESAGLALAFRPWRGAGQQRQTEEAQAQFAKALVLAPNHPSILNNQAIAYALDGKAGEAEKLLRKAASGQREPRSRKNAAEPRPRARAWRQVRRVALGRRGRAARSTKPPRTLPTCRSSPRPAPLLPSIRRPATKPCPKAASAGLDAANLSARRLALEAK